MITLICGEAALDPAHVGYQCRQNPLDEVYALPWVRTPEECGQSLKVNRGRPDRVTPCVPNNDPLDAVSLPFDEKLEGDALGRMANLVANRVRVKNEIMKSDRPVSFYGQTIMKDWEPGCSFIISCDRMNEWFPSAPLSAKLYSMTTVPVQLRNTEQFRLATGCQEEMVNVLVATDFLPGSVTFYRFYRLMSSRDFACMRNDTDTNVIFRNDKGYRLDSDAKETLRTMRCPQG